MVNPGTELLSNLAVVLAYWLATLIPAVVAFWKGRGPWMIWSLAQALLTLPAAIVSAPNRPFESNWRWLVPIFIWLGAWFFAKVAINERVRDEQAANQGRT